MMSNFTFFPKLNENIIKTIGYNENEKFNFSFIENDILKTISIKDYNNVTLNFIDEHNRWFFNQNNLIVNKKISFNSDYLFGTEGIAPINSTIGVAVAWESPKSLSRGVEHQFDLKYGNEIINKNIEIRFEPKQLRESVKIKIILYLKEKASLQFPYEFYLCNTEGTILGVLDEITLNFVGDGSTFPTEIINDPNKPLWEIKINLEYYKEVSETLLLFINEAHKDFPLFNYKDERFNEDFLTEVMISIVSIILIKSIDEIDEIRETTYIDGTLGSLINYYLNSFEIDTTSIESIFASVGREIR